MKAVNLFTPKFNLDSPQEPWECTSIAKWGDWRVQIANRIKEIDTLRQWMTLTPAEEASIIKLQSKYRWSITQYYASLMDKFDPRCPIRLQAVPNLQEMNSGGGTSIDPAGDMVYRKTNRVVHKYPDRVIFLTTSVCPVYCRHCTRKYHTTDFDGTYLRSKTDNNWDMDLAYIADHPEIRDVLLTGGDPLSLGDDKLANLLERIRAINHVQIIRIGTRYPVVMPARITRNLCKILESIHPVWLNTQFNHPKEVTSEAAAACDRLTRHGIPVQNQSVLLKGVNDDLNTMKSLVHRLLEIRVRPYYLYHCDNVKGVSHFMTTIEKGREIIDGLLGHTTGFAVPQYVLTTDIGKIPAARPKLIHDSDGAIWVEGFQREKKKHTAL